MENVNTILTNPDANAFFGRSEPILCSGILESTLRYIALKHHEGEIEKLKPITAIVAYFVNYREASNLITNYNNTELCIGIARSGTSLPVIDEEGWVSQDSPPYPVAPFLSKCSETKVYTNADKQRTVVFVKSATDKWITAFTSSLFRILPWYFSTMTEEETKLFRAISNDDQNTFLDIINSCCNYDFDDMVTRRTLINWGNSYTEYQIKWHKSRSNDLMTNISTLEKKIADILDELSEVNLNLSMLQAQAHSDSNEVYDFFKSRKNIGIASVISSSDDSQRLRYYVTDTLEYFDKDQFLRIYHNPSSWLSYEPDVREILYGCFIQEKGSIQVEGVFELSGLSSIVAVSNVISGRFKNTHLPHPHIYRFGCLGNNRSYIQEFLNTGEWGMAIDQTVSAIKNINFGDTTVCISFVEDIADRMDTCRCIIADNGVHMTPREFLSYIRELNDQPTRIKYETTEE